MSGIETAIIAQSILRNLQRGDIMVRTTDPAILHIPYRAPTQPQLIRTAPWWAFWR